MTQDWRRDAAIYQIYPRSFQDSNGDGIGDLQGIRERLPYVASLGVDAIWISPFVRSPMKDFGYDVEDYCAIEPMFGDLTVFDALLADAHELGLKVLMDQVWNHTSDQHPWFRESRENRDNPKADWYVWQDPALDGGPPNNWRATFGGSAWQFDDIRRQYYLHNFLDSQPDLNWYNPQVRQAILQVGRFWLDRGVDGFRLDVINFLAYDRSLADNPERPPDVPRPAGAGHTDPYFERINRGTVCRPETLEMLGDIRQMADDYPGTVLLGEISSAEDSLADAADYVRDGRLHLAYNASLISDEPFTAIGLHNLLTRTLELFPHHQLCWTFGTHDFPRLKGRWIRSSQHEAILEQRLDVLLISLLVGLPGACCIYQGDELGLTQAQLTFEDLRDPYGIANWPNLHGRDGCRTPMPWQATLPHGGFSQARSSWLPMPAEHLPLAVDRQQGEAGSLLNTYRRMLLWRRHMPALRGGETKLFSPQGNVLIFERGDGENRILCIYNFAPEPATLDLSTLPDANSCYKLCEEVSPEARLNAQALQLPAFGVSFLFA
ncbi:alpha-glucosidase [Azomonas macrocytogenes]|uniref:Alpha-glucosidase n=1 Tax=Azomonas macrocytogenes TaxID=69962 RepID=A0A839T7L0_AZOMA|nr:alpha-glucosidase [Azomonas macrocytogenes]MBB3104446.1 alpha-glucosidase [Azomonas macrocytogenes]